MNESALSNDPGTQKRRSTRIVQAVPITVTGVDALGQPFKERTTTVMAESATGVSINRSTTFPRILSVTLDIPGRLSPVARRTPFKGEWCGFSVRAPFANFFRLGWNLKRPATSGASRSLPMTGKHPSRKVPATRRAPWRSFKSSR